MNSPSPPAIAPSSYGVSSLTAAHEAESGGRLASIRR